MTDGATHQACSQLLRARRFDEAARLAETGLRASANDPSLWHVLGSARLALGHSSEAVSALKRCVEFAPGHPAAWDLLGVAQQRSGDREAAAEAFGRSLELRPRSAATCSNAAANACDLGRFDEALRYAARALEIDPGLAPAWLAQANGLLGLGRADEAVAAYGRTLALRPHHAPSLFGLGKAHARLGRNEEALAALEEAAALSPNSAPVLAQFAAVLTRCGRASEAMDAYARALRLAPDDLPTRSQYLFELSHLDEVEADRLFEEHRRFGEIVEASWRGRWGPWSNSPDPDRRIRVGFVSGDLREHAVARFVEPIWASLDPAQFAIHAYHTRRVEDATTARLRGLAAVWHHVRDWSDDELDATIRADGIDILFDLSGHTSGHRLPVFARKPAPVQISWIGYPGTTGLSAIDYRIIDGDIAPPGCMDDEFTEKLIRLGRGVRFLPEPDIPPPSALPASERGYVTFGSFNRPSKFNRRTAQLWSGIFRRLPDARLLMASVSDDFTRARVSALLESCGITADRVSFRSRVPLREYYGLHAEVDILLDSVPYTGGTTTSQALWMGVPTLTLGGGGMQQRQGSAHLRRARMDDWIATSDADFVDRACAAVADLDALARLRARLPGELARRVDDAAGSGDLGPALREVWRRWCEGLPVIALDFRNGADR